METFARYYCYAKKQKQGQIVLNPTHPGTVEGGEEQPVLEIEIEEKQSDEDDDI